MCIRVAKSRCASLRLNLSRWLRMKCLVRSQKSLPAIALQAADTLSQWKTIGCDSLTSGWIATEYGHRRNGAALLIKGQSGRARAVQCSRLWNVIQRCWVYVSSRDPKALKRLARLLKLDVPIEHRVSLKWLIESENVDNRTFSAEDFSRSVVSSIVFSIRSLNEQGLVLSSRISKSRTHPKTCSLVASRRCG